MSKYSEEEVRMMAEYCRKHFDQTALPGMLLAYAERIEADERAVPIMWQSRQTAIDPSAPHRSWSEWLEWRRDDRPGIIGSAMLEYRPLFTHPPAQAAQSDPNIPTERDELKLQLVEVMEERDHLRSVLADQPRAVPDGWVLVPIVPSDHMESAFGAEYVQRNSKCDLIAFRDSYKAMLATAPQPGESS